MTSDTIHVDVAIVGGGVAGSSLAIALRRSGLDIAVVEREARFRDRVRGDALFPWGAAEAGRLGIADVLPVSGARPLPIWQTYSDRAPGEAHDWRNDVPTGDVLWGVDHPGLQESLIGLAGIEGAQVLRPARAIGLERVGPSSHWVLVENPAGVSRIVARLVVGADGQRSIARRWVGARTQRDPVHHVLGGCLLEDVDLDPDASHVSRFEGGMVLVFRHGSGRARGYVVAQPALATEMRGSDAAARFIAICAAAFPEGAFSSARAVGPAAFFPAADVYSERTVGNGVVLIGDAAGANDPAQGQGLSLAFRDVRELSHLLLAGDDWHEAIHEFSRRRGSWYEPLRAYAIWRGPLVTDIGEAADAARERAERAASLDPYRFGYGAIHALGPEGLPVTEEARRRFLGADLAAGNQGGTTRETIGQ